LSVSERKTNQCSLLSRLSLSDFNPVDLDVRVDESVSNKLKVNMK